MTINLQKPDITELKPRINVFGVGGGGGNAVNNMINAGLHGVEFVVANTDAQALATSKVERVIQLGAAVTEGLGAGSHPEVGRAAAEECLDEIVDHLINYNMVFVTAGMGGGTGTGAAPVIARAAREKGLLTVGVVTKPFDFEGQRRMKTAEAGIEELQKNVDTLIVIPNQNLFRIANEKTTFADAFAMADQVLYSGVASITDLMVREGLINLDFADVRSVMLNMGKAMMGTGEASEEGRALAAAEAAISNPLLDESSVRGARGLLISVTGGRDMTLFEVDQATTRIRNEVDPEANLIFGAIIDEDLQGFIRVSVVATGIDHRASNETAMQQHHKDAESYFTSEKKMPTGTSVEVKEEEKKLGTFKNKHVPVMEDSFYPHSQIFSKGSQNTGSENFQKELTAGIEKNIPRTAVSQGHSQHSVLPTGFGQQQQLSSSSPAVFSKHPIQSSAHTEHFSYPTIRSEEATSQGGDMMMAPTAWRHPVRTPPLPIADDVPPLQTKIHNSDNNYHEQHKALLYKQQDSAHSPRNLWRKIQDFIYPEEEERIARLEPAKQDKGTPDLGKKVSESEQQSYQHSSVYTQEIPSSYAAVEEHKEVSDVKLRSPHHFADDEERLEIPSFLRRHVN